MRLVLKIGIIITFSIAVFILFQNSTTISNQKTYSTGYTLDNPDKVFELEDELHEISGLSPYKENVILAVQDEKGVIYEFDYKKGRVVERHKFSDKGDYEGIEAVGSHIYVINSSGDVFKVKHLGAPIKTTKKYKTKLGSKNDTEGLAFDFEKEQLLIACKEAYKLDGEGHKKRAVYRFSIDDKELKKKPLIEFKIKEALSKTDYAQNIKPSGIAIHPITKHIFIIDSVGKTLLIMDKNGEIKTIVELDDELFNQPEGIAILSDGTMFIANEGGSSHANILQFKYTPE